jgi:uncharacterized protein
MLGGAGSASHAGAYEDYFLGIALDRPPIVAKLLQRGFDVNARDSEGQHGLYVALREGSREVMTLLLDQPALDVESPNRVNETLLMMAALRGEMAAMKRLLERGARVDRPGWSPLHYAASGASQDAVKLLLERGAGLEAPAPNGNTPLMMAAGYGGIDSARLLLKRGADAAARNKQGQTAADLARRAGRDTLAEELDHASRR